VALFHARQDQAKEAAENERKRATRRAERYLRRLPKETMKMFRGLTKEQRAEFDEQRWNMIETAFEADQYAERFSNWRERRFGYGDQTVEQEEGG
jgi:hypothetical protein